MFTFFCWKQKSVCEYKNQQSLSIIWKAHLHVTVCACKDSFSLPVFLHLPKSASLANSWFLSMFLIMPYLSFHCLSMSSRSIHGIVSDVVWLLLILCSLDNLCDSISIFLCCSVAMYEQNSRVILYRAMILCWRTNWIQRILVHSFFFSDLHCSVPQLHFVLVFQWARKNVSCKTYNTCSYYPARDYSKAKQINK